MALNALPEPPVRAPDRGDRFILEHDYESVTPAGDRAALWAGLWRAVIHSRRRHLVRSDNVGLRPPSRPGSMCARKGYLPPFEEAGERVQLDFVNDRRLTMNEDFYDTLRERYTVEITINPARQARPDAAQAPPDTAR